MSKIWSDFRQLSNQITNLRNRSTYRKSEKWYLINYISSPIGRKNLANFGPLTKKLQAGAHVDPPTWTFSGYWPLGCRTLKFLLLRLTKASAHTNLDGGPLQNFKGEHLKLGLKFSTRVLPINLGLVAITTENVTRRRATRQGDNVDTKFGGCPQQNLGGRKTLKILCDF